MSLRSTYEILVCKCGRQTKPGRGARPWCARHGLLKDEDYDVVEVVPKRNVIASLAYHCPPWSAAEILRTINRGGRTE